MPDASVFYEELAQWLSAHASHIQPGTELVLALQFLNSASIRALYVFLRTIKERQFPLRIVIIHQGRSDNEDVVEFLVEACRLLGLDSEVREEP
jgi:type II secretory pathway component PulJ